MMTLVSASDDFRIRTLAALPGLWAKLRYLAGLRSPDGAYQHWGMSRTYGEEAAQKAAAAVHSDVFLEFLRTPVRQLAREFSDSPSSSSTQPADWSSYVPQDLGGGSLKHFNSVVSALQKLSESPRK